MNRKIKSMKRSISYFRKRKFSKEQREFKTTR